MALKIKETNQYLKLELDGSYTLYETEAARKTEKKVTPWRQVLEKYSQILWDLDWDIERRYYDPSYFVEYKAWKEEYLKYRQDIRTQTIGNKYPLMKKYIKDIEKTIPRIVSTGRLAVKGETLEEVYNSAKRYGYFGEVEDI